MAPPEPAAARPPSPIDEAAVVAAYSRWAPVYDAVFGLPFLTGRRAIAKIVNALPPGRILEAGVGTGMALKRYDRKHRVFGIDLSPDMLARARTRVARGHLGHVEGLEVMDAGNLAFPDRSFDAVVAMYVMTVVPDPDKVMAEFVRVTPPGGRLVVIGHFASSGGFYHWVERRLARFAARIGWNPDMDVERLMGRPDLRLVARRKLGPLWLFTLLTFERV
ncbi:MAG: methyltransferase domain-containing protein [Bauldia sp.]|nr:methyltransferase domain-containing protein [Bauldia sp.]